MHQRLNYLREIGLTPFIVAGVHVEAVELVPVCGLQVIPRDSPDLQARISDSLPLL